MKIPPAIVATAIALASAPVALAQPDEPLDVRVLVQNPKIQVHYLEPRHPIYGYFIDSDDARVAKEFTANVQRYKRLSDVRQRLMERRLLEEFSQFLAPLKLPIMLRLQAEQCDAVNAYYNWVESKITLCYEWVAFAEETAPKATTPQGITREDAVIGAVVGVLLHEAGHAVSNLLRLPVLGREEDTADQFAGFLSLQFGTDVARTLIKGEAYSWHIRTARTSAYWGVHSTALQRQHMYLCLAYGKEPAAFEDFVTKYGWLPKERAENCANEYKQALHAFRTTIVPHLDMDLVKIVQGQRWLRPQDGQKR